MDTYIDDIGSFPLPTGIRRDDYAKAYEMARIAITNGDDPYQDPFIEQIFCTTVVNSFKCKLATGLNIPNYPQHFNGMRQVGDAIHTAMANGSFVVEEKNAILPELYVLNREAKRISEGIGKKIELRVSIFGPLEQYLNEVGTTAYPDVLCGFAQTINRFAKNSILNTKYIETKVISIDEPSLGHSPFTGSTELIKETLEKTCDFKGPTRQIHLHFASAIHDLMVVKGIDVLSFEYAASPKNIDTISKSMLDAADKQIRVGVARTDIDAIWAEFYDKGIPQPLAEQIVESTETIKKRYWIAKAKYGDRMTFTGPDCGMGSWPSQDAAALLLKRCVTAVKTV